MCRKWTSSLVAHFLVVQSTQFYPPLGSSPDFKEYSSSPGGLRGFCGKCGTSLTWRQDQGESGGSPYTIEVFLGTIDHQWLAEERNVAKILATPSGSQCWLENAIEGITDTLKGGKRYLQARSDTTAKVDVPGRKENGVEHSQ